MTGNSHDASTPSILIVHTTVCQINYGHNFQGWFYPKWTLEVVTITMRYTK